MGAWGRLGGRERPGSKGRERWDEICSISLRGGAKKEVVASGRSHSGGRGYVQGAGPLTGKDAQCSPSGPVLWRKQRHAQGAWLEAKKLFQGGGARAWEVSLRRGLQGAGPAGAVVR